MINTKLSSITNNTPIEYITEYQSLSDKFSKTTASDSYSEIQNTLDDLNRRVLRDISTLDNYEKNIGRVYNQLNKSNDTQVTTSTEEYVSSTIIGVIFLCLLYFIMTQPNPVDTISK